VICEEQRFAHLVEGIDGVLCRRGDLSITEVCFAVGYSPLDTFSSRFTRTGRYTAQRLSAPRGVHDSGDAVVRGETGDQTRNRQAPVTEPQLE
jgi:AraC-like DNA-binding protein